MASSEDRVELSEDRQLLGVKGSDGKLVRTKSPNLKKAMGKLGIMTDDLVPPLRETFNEECKRDGVTIPDVIQKRWEVMETRRLEEIDEVLQKRAKLIAAAAKKREAGAAAEEAKKQARKIEKEKEHARKRLDAAKRTAEEERA